MEIVSLVMLTFTLFVCCPAEFTTFDSSGYLSNEQLYQFMRESNRQYPNQTHIYSIGKSLQGQELLVIALSGSRPDEHVLLRPETKYVGNIHGNEVIGRELLVRFISSMLEGYGTNETVTRLMDGSRIHVMPTMNPDGYAESVEGHCFGLIGRFNGNTKDLNRDFLDVFNSTYQTREKMQPETLAIVKWLESQQFVLSANFHGGSMVANYPYDTTLHPDTIESYASPSICEDDDTFQMLARTYSYSSNLRSGDCPGFKDGITNGAEWYIALGGMQDYNYAFGGCMELTLEVSCCKYPPFNQVELFWLNNKDALTAYLEKVNIGVKGVVLTDDGQPAAGVDVRVDSRMVVKTTPLGEYWKLLLPGQYQLSVTRYKKVLSTMPIMVTEAGVAVYNITLPYSASSLAKISGQPLAVNGHSSALVQVTKSFYLFISITMAIYIFSAVKL